MNIFTPLVTTTLLQASTISTTNLFTPFIQASTISTTNLFTNFLQASTISTTNLFTNFLQASTISTTNLFTNYIQASTISTTNIYTRLVSTSFLQASTVSTLSLNTRNISSLFSQTSSILTGSVTLRGSGGSGLVTTNTTGSQLLFNGSQVGSWVGTATTDLNMASFNINNVTNLNGTAVASIGGSSWSQYPATQTVNLNGNSVVNVNDLTVTGNTNMFGLTVTTGTSLNDVTIFGSATVASLSVADIADINDLNISGNAYAVQNTTVSSNIATNYVLPLYKNFTSASNNVAQNGVATSYAQIVNYTGACITFARSPFTFYNTTFQFAGTASSNTNGIYYYLSLSNISRSTEVFGITNSTNALYYSNASLNNKKSFTFSYSDVFNTTGWAEGEIIIPQIYCLTDSAYQYKFSPNSLNLIMQPVASS